MSCPLDDREMARWRAEVEVALAGALRDQQAASFTQTCFRAEQAAQLAVKGLLRGIG